MVRGKVIQSSSARTIKVQRGRNSWLYASAVARLKPNLSAEDLKDEVHRCGYGDVTIRRGGGRQLVISFQSVEAKREKLLLMKEWLTDWCESVEDWEEGMVMDQVRQVWLSCYGVPLVLWNNSTFCNIGREWGVVLEMDEDTSNLSSFHYGKVKIETRCMDIINHTINLECKGVIYPVRICEEQIIISKVVQESCICQSFMRNNEESYSCEEEEETIADRGSRQEKEDDDVEIQVSAEVGKGCEVAAEDRVTEQVPNDMEEEDRLKEISVVDESEMMMGGSEIGAARKEDSIRKLCQGESEVGGARKEGSWRGDDEVYTPGFIKSLSGSVGPQQGINIEVNLNRAQLGTSKEGSAQRVAESGNGVVDNIPPNSYKRLKQPSVLYNRVNSAHIRKNKLKEKGMVSRSQKILKQWKHKEGKTAMQSSLNLRKGAVFRSTVAAISLSMASKSSRGRFRLSKAEASLQIGKVLGVDCDGKEEEVISKLEELEAIDKGKGVRRRDEEH